MDPGILAKLFETTGLPKHQIKSVINKFNGTPVLSDLFWDSLRQDPELELHVVDELCFTAKLGRLTGQHLPLVRELQRRRKQGEIRSAADLFDLDWQEIIAQRAGQRNIGAPKEIPGKNPAQRAQNYACQLSEKLVENFPTEAIVHAARQNSDPVEQALVRFYEDNPGFDFRGAGIDSYLSRYPAALGRNPDEEKPVVVDRLKRLQRLFRLTDGLPDQYAAIRKLEEQGFDSAHSIAGMGEADFCNKFATEPGIRPQTGAAPDDVRISQLLGEMRECLKGNPKRSN